MKTGTAIFLAVLLVLATMVGPSEGGISGAFAYPLCQTGCNTAWVACLAGLGVVAGTATAGAAAPAAVLACNAAQGICMAACAAMCLSPF
ncbi:hypothetical protein BV898_07102 [Hypsibius exemplaris]|uniref:Uncharacterized protein n=1 Tax=Hypsibius exemplaris TaxID=2072580 RepID=A0A1W0WUG9_HYPEX|nr:hypothetical protein BV898_07102 [Hypsibius exemplaris]